jgi:uncharacterized membrane protein YtjA (UPF0391 family)
VVEHLRVFRYVGFCIGPDGTSPNGRKPFVLEELTMLQLAITCLVIALVAALLGFGGIAGSFVGVAKILFVVFLVLALLSFLGGGMRRGRLWG